MDPVPGWGRSALPVLRGCGVRKRLAVLVLMAVLASLACLVQTAAPASGAPVIQNEQQFRKAWHDHTQTGILLGADIILRHCAAGTPLRSSATPLKVDGRGFRIRQTCKGQGVLEQQGTGPLTFDRVTITGGDNTRPGGAGSGGGIRDVNGPVTLTNSTVTANKSSATGGGIAAIGSVSLTNSTVSNNRASLDAGGIGAHGVTVTNSTVSGNGAGGAGGGIQNSGAATLRFATVVGNSATNGANVAFDSTPFLTLTSATSVVALPSGSANCAFGPAGTTNSSGFNYSDDSSCGFTSSSDTQNGGNPLLGPLANNGGPTFTRPPMTGSPLIDAFFPPSPNSCGVAADQRGVSRPQGFGCDIGAVEVVPPPPD